jgi:hypothetical protein
VGLQHRVDGLEPLPGLDGIQVFQLERFGHVVCQCAGRAGASQSDGAGAGLRRRRVVPRRDRMSRQ